MTFFVCLCWLILALLGVNHVAPVWQWRIKKEATERMGEALTFAHELDAQVASVRLK